MLYCTAVCRVPHGQRPGRSLGHLVWCVCVAWRGVADTGLQDRVVQIYEGLVFMDFSKALFDKQKHGNYEQMDPSGPQPQPKPPLPRLQLIYYKLLD